MGILRLSPCCFPSLQYRFIWQAVATKCSSPSSDIGTCVPAVLSFSHSFQSCVFQLPNLSVICPSPFLGQKLSTRPVRLVKVCVGVCALVCEKVHRPCLIGREHASLRLSLPLNYLPAITFFFFFPPLLQKSFRRLLANVLSSHAMILFRSISVSHLPNSLSLRFSLYSSSDSLWDLLDSIYLTVTPLGELVLRLKR